jgi:hypothetical protein
MMHQREGREDEGGSEGRKEGFFSVWRLDDNNNEFLVRDGLTEEEAWGWYGSTRGGGIGRRIGCNRRAGRPIL